jgi:uncharacterized protein YndB with AHSA1/START domain
MQLEPRTDIGVPPAAVFRFFEEMPDNYSNWHPDHVEFRWVDGNGLSAGTTAYFAERIAGTNHERTVRFVEVVPNERIVFTPTSRLVRFLMPRISFAIEPREAGCTLVQRITIRTGPIGAWLNRREFDAVRTHMREEGANLKRLVEGDASTAEGN